MPQQNMVVVTIDDCRYEIDFSDLTAVDAKDFRREVGIPLMSVLSNQEQPDLDVFAGLVWLARRKTEPDITYNDVAAAINWTSNVDLVQAEETSSPEA